MLAPCEAMALTIANAEVSGSAIEARNAVRGQRVDFRARIDRDKGGAGEDHLLGPP
jgi:hypothetical protein